VEMVAGAEKVFSGAEIWRGGVVGLVGSAAALLGGVELLAEAGDAFFFFDDFFGFGFFFVAGALPWDSSAAVEVSPVVVSSIEFSAVGISEAEASAAKGVLVGGEEAVDLAGDGEIVRRIWTFLFVVDAACPSVASGEPGAWGDDLLASMFLLSDDGGGVDWIMEIVAEFWRLSWSMLLWELAKSD
jgi:hypothetical protein